MNAILKRRKRLRFYAANKEIKMIVSEQNNIPKQVAEIINTYFCNGICVSNFCQ